MIDFDKNECNSIKLIAVERNATVGIISRFIKEKKLIFAKISLKSFAYDLINVFCFPTEEVGKIYNQYDIMKCHMYLNLTDTNSCSCCFNFICKENVTSKKVN